MKPGQVDQRRRPDAVVQAVTQEERARIVRQLADGADREQVAARMGLPYDTVMRVAVHHGYPRRESLRLAAGILERNLAEGRTGPVTIDENTGRTAPNAEPLRPPPPSTRPSPPRPFTFADLLAEARTSPHPLTRAAADQALAAVETLRDLVQADRDEAAPSSSVAHPLPARTHSPTGRIRAWARRAGLAPAVRGPLPAEIVAAYEAAHPGELS